MSVDTHVDTRAALVVVLGPDFEHHLARDLTAQELADVEAGLAAHDGDVAAAAGVHVDGDTAAYLQRLVGSTR
ncbi:hypothetical protein ACQP2Y_21325 [Actinoplanes sp. CA-051413]|uniref:hypothetical protein n=1 Tax=Actinoplanes sp. CA-051413 TaxID=3239899 RepID=UPI003D99C9F4